MALAARADGGRRRSFICFGLRVLAMLAILRHLTASIDRFISVLGVYRTVELCHRPALDRPPFRFTVGAGMLSRNPLGFSDSLYHGS